MRKAIVLGMIMVSMSVFGGCGKQAAAYSNLADQTAQSDVIAILERDGLLEEQTEKVFQWVEDFNAITQSHGLAQGFEKLPEEGMDYSALLMDDTSEACAYLQWLNCRLTAFSLLKDQIETAKTGTDLDTWLMFDIEAIDTVPELQMTKDERANFITLFNQVSVAQTTTVEEHEERIRQAWEDRDIKIASDKISMVCVYLHAPEEQARFVGHAGVLAEKEDGLLFFEKYSNLAPFQATYFQNREQLKKYLLSRDDLYGDETELEPIITENGNIL
jgi:hypothetical protein